MSKIARPNQIAAVPTSIEKFFFLDESIDWLKNSRCLVSWSLDSCIYNSDSARGAQSTRRPATNGHICSEPLVSWSSWGPIGIRIYSFGLLVV